MIDAALPVVHQIPLAELAHIQTRIHPGKLAEVERLCRLDVSKMPAVWLSRATPDAPCRLEDGNHRLHASRVLGLPMVPAIVSISREGLELHERLYADGLIGLVASRHLERLRAEARERQAWLRAVLTGNPEAFR
jgi:hypothetical protein